MTNRRIIIFFLIVLALLAATFRPAGDKKFSSSNWGLTFNYPKNYLLTGRAINTARPHQQVLLVDESFRGGDEGPTAITIDVYPKNSAGETLDDWVRTTTESNFKLSSGAYATTTVIGVPAIEYDWDGLYRGHTVATAWGNNILAFSVTFFSPGDKITRDFTKILSSVTWSSVP